MARGCTQPAALTNQHDTWLPLRLRHNGALVQVLNGGTEAGEGPPLASEGVTVQAGASWGSTEGMNEA